MGAENTEDEHSRTAAAIDIGTNSVRMVVAQVFPGGHTELLEQTRRPVRLGHDAFVEGRLSQETMDAAIRVLRDYHRILDTYQAELVRAVATSAVREASNRDAFLDRIARTVGLDVEVIEPMEQSRLIVAAVRNDVRDTLDLHAHNTMIAEVGGGSTLVTILQKGEITASQSFNIGSIRMQEILSTVHEPPEHAAEMLRQHVENAVERVRTSLPMRAARRFVAIGGDARFAARQVGKSMPGSELPVVTKDHLGHLVKECASHAPEDLAKTYGVPFADAETLVPALLVYRALLNATRAREMIVSQVSMRDGLLLDLPRYVTGREDAALAESILLSAKTVGARYRYDAKHAERVAEMAVHLFDELQKEHALTRRHRLLLEVAGLLHDTGSFIASRAHHKHSYYLIANTEIFGLGAKDITTVAHVARYHRRSVPKSTHLEYMALPLEQRMVINKLAAILRVVNALARGHWQQAGEFEAERQGRDLVIYVKGLVDSSLERRALEETGDLFEDMFGMRIRLEEASSHSAGASGLDAR